MTEREIEQVYVRLRKHGEEIERLGREVSKLLGERRRMFWSWLILWVAVFVLLVDLSQRWG